MMFSKGTWTLLKLKQEEGQPTPLEAFTTAFSNFGSQYIPLVALSRAIHGKTQTIGLSPFFSPRLGDEEEIEFYFEDPNTPEYKIDSLESFIVNYNDLSEWTLEDAELVKPGPSTLRIPLGPFWKPNLSDWFFRDGVLGMWFMDFEYVDALDSNSKKEQLAYGFGAPFKLQTGDIKKQIQDQIVSANTFTRKHYQIIIDFNMNYVWVNTASKPIIHAVCGLLDECELTVDNPINLLGEVCGDSVHVLLQNLYESSLINEAMVRRLAEMKLHGPKGITPDDDATQEKILKSFCAFSELDGYHVGMSAPVALFLSRGFVTTTAAKTSFEVTELFGTHEEAAIDEAALTFCYLTERAAKTGEMRRHLEQQFTITATPNFFFTGEDAPPGLIIKGLTIENFKHTLKTHVKATGEVPTIAEYWSLYYDSMKTAVFTYYGLLKDAEVPA